MPPIIHSDRSSPFKSVLKKINACQIYFGQRCFLNLASVMKASLKSQALMRQSSQLALEKLA